MRNHDLAQARFIHVSDPHFGPGHRFDPPTPPDGNPAPRRGFPSLAESIRADLEHDDFAAAVWHGDGVHVSPLVLAISGDLTQSASDAEFQRAEGFVTEFCSSPVLSTRLNVAQTALVPGNHDVRYGEKTPSDRWAPYTSFARRLRGLGSSSSAGHDATRVVDRTAERLLLVEINSAAYVEKDTPETNRGVIDQQAIADLRRGLEAVDEKRAACSIKVAILHHHPVVLPTLAEPGRGYDAVVNANLLLAMLRDFGFHLVLHGHKHHPHTFSYDASSAWRRGPTHPLLVVAGGTAGAGDGAVPHEPGATNTYNAVSVRWNPMAGHGRVLVVTRGLVRYDDRGQDLPAPMWTWRTLRVDDRLIGTGSDSPDSQESGREFVPADAPLEVLRKQAYDDLRQNMLVAEVMPSFDTDQAYEVKVWLVPHYADARELPRRVEWSAGPKFGQVAVCERDRDSTYCAKFTYWDGMLVQARLHFEDGQVVTAAVYARKPGKK